MNHNQQDYMKIKSDADTDGRAVAITVAIFCLIGLAAILLSALGCGGVATVVGDPYSVAVKNEGRPTWARTVEDEKWCEWFIDNRISGGPWAVVAFDLKDWEAWTAKRTIAFEKSVEVDPAARTVMIDGLEYKMAPEPRAKWVRYNLRALHSMLPRL